MTACSVQPTATGWKVAYRHDGKQRSRSFNTRAEANRWASMVRAAGIEAALAVLADESVAEPVALTDALERHLEQLVVKPGTLLEYRRLAARTWQPRLGPLPVHAITKARIVAWVRHAHEVDRKSPKTISNAHGLLSGVLSTAVEEGWITGNPCRGVRMPTGERREKIWLTEAEGAALIRALPDYWQPLVVVIASTGMRLGEVTALQWQDIDWTAGTIKIARGWHKVGGRYVISSTKTRRSNRTVSLPPVAVAALDVVRARTVRPTAGRTVFVGEHGGTQVWPAWWRESIWHPARRAAGIGVDMTGPDRFDEDGRLLPRPDLVGADGKRLPRATPHSLRDSHVAWLISRGQALPVIQARLGHESITTTINVYGHLQADVVRASVDAAQDALRAIEPPPAAS